MMTPPLVCGDSCVLFVCTLSMTGKSTLYKRRGHFILSIQRRNSYQKVIICISEPRRLIFVYGGAISALPENDLLWLQRCDFRTVKKPFHCLQRRKICTFSSENRRYAEVTFLSG